MIIDFITKLSDILTEPNDDFSDGHFELQNFILPQILTEKDQLILQLLCTYTIIKEEYALACYYILSQVLEIPQAKSLQA